MNTEQLRALAAGSPTIHERDGWRWINCCPRCGAETFHEDDWTWICDNGHCCDMPNEVVVGRSAAQDDPNDMMICDMRCDDYCADYPDCMRRS